MKKLDHLARFTACALNIPDPSAGLGNWNGDNLTPVEKIGPLAFENIASQHNLRKGRAAQQQERYPEHTQCENGGEKRDPPGLWKLSVVIGRNQGGQTGDEGGELETSGSQARKR